MVLVNPPQVQIHPKYKPMDLTTKNAQPNPTPLQPGLVGVCGKVVLPALDHHLQPFYDPGCLKTAAATVSCGEVYSAAVTSLQVQCKTQQYS